jgi:hypothetical protein
MTDLNNNYLLIYLARFKSTQSFRRLPFVKSGFAAVLLLAVIVCTALLSDPLDLSIKDILPAKKLSKIELSSEAEKTVFLIRKKYLLFSKKIFSIATHPLRYFPAVIKTTIQ